MSIDTPKVSIVTTLGDRNEFIPLLKYCVQSQTYPSEYLEWLVLDDGDLDRSSHFDSEICTYIKLYKKFNIGRKRQIASDIACGEFIIFFDDDDIHFSHRIEKSVSRLQKVGSRFVVGNSKMLICDLNTEKVYEVGPYHKNHCTAGTMCFRKEILKGTSFRASDKSGEEAHFLKNWAIPVVQLDKEDTIICLSHDQNTVNKSHLLKEENFQKNLNNYSFSNEIIKILKNIKKSVN